MKRKTMLPVSPFTVNYPEMKGTTTPDEYRISFVRDIYNTERTMKLPLASFKILFYIQSNNTDRAERFKFDLEDILKVTGLSKYSFNIGIKALWKNNIVLPVYRKKTDLWLSPAYFVIQL